MTDQDKKRLEEIRMFIQKTAGTSIHIIDARFLLRLLDEERERVLEAFKLKLDQQKIGIAFAEKLIESNPREEFIYSHRKELFGKQILEELAEEIELSPEELQ